MAEKAGLAGARKTIWIATTISAAWLAILVWLLWESESCQANGAPIVLHHFDTWLTCRKANEVGDFLAGAFAPLAFIWLAVAVLIQSMELAAQREELRLARAEAEGTRKTLEAQTKSYEKNVSLMQSQIEIQLQRKKMEDFKESDRLIEKSIRLLATYLRESRFFFDLGDGNRLEFNQGDKLSDFAIILANAEIMSVFERRIETDMRRYSSVQISDLSDLNTLSYLIFDIENSYQTASESMKKTLSALRFDEIVKCVRKIWKVCTKD